MTGTTGHSRDLLHSALRSSRRGNTIVLVVGLLVLLVIIATGYLTRTHAARVTSASQQRSALRDDNARSIGEFLASEVSEALFVRPVNVPPGTLASSNAPRLSLRALDSNNDGILEAPIRYGVDPADSVDEMGAFVRDGLPDFPYNYAPFVVVPVTNWPDAASYIVPDPLLPGGPGNPGGGTPNFNLDRETNEVGDPGFGDSRWLADTEPLRFHLTGSDLIPYTFDDEYQFTHWRHMSNLSRPGNGWRICRDIEDIIGAGVVTDLRIPIEQFLVVESDSRNAFTLLPSIVSQTAVPFFDRWQTWFGGPLQDVGQYLLAYSDPGLIPPNFLDLSDLDGNGVAHDFEIGGVWQDRPQAELIPGTARHTVGRVLADADGDGFTDSFWFLAPTMVERGVRQIVAARIIDNSAMINVNAATRFVPADPTGVGALPTKTRGRTPADLALVGNLLPYDFGDPYLVDSFNVGFYDNPEHWHGFMRYDDNNPFPNGNNTEPFDLWRRHVTEVGLAVDTFLWPWQRDRSDYWLRAGLSPLDPDPLSGYTPFGMPEEIELRMYHGNNYPWIFSRLERSTQSTAGISMGFLHGGTVRVESSEYLDQLTNVELAADSRRKTTVYSGARNETMPPWLWPSVLPRDVNGDLTIQARELDQFRADMRKYDLRRPLTVLDIDGDGVVEPRVSLADDPLDDDLDNNGALEPFDHHLRLQQYLQRALLDGVGGSYIDGHVEETQRMAASFAANIACYRDQDAEPLSINEAITWVDPSTSAVYRYIGMERQPFLTEAFVGHVYKSNNLATNLPFEVQPGYTNYPNNLVFHEDWVPRDTIVIVQLANPFDVPLVLDDPSALSHFKLRVFSTNSTFEADLRNYGSIAASQRLTLYAIDAQLSDGEAFRAPWLTELGLADPSAHDVNDPTNDLPGNPPESGWSTNRDEYDTGSENHAVELVRVLRDQNTGQSFDIVVDRIDIKPGGSGSQTDFGRAVNELLNTRPPPFPSFPPGSGQGLPFPGLEIGDETHWIQWAHALRGWDLGTPPLDPDQRSPRYVFAEREVTAGDAPFHYAGNDVVGFTKPTKFETTQKADIQRHLYSLQMLQKDGDFEQVGELLNVWLFGHELRFQPASGTYDTENTFSEFMIQRDLVGDDRSINRLRVKTDTGTGLSAVIGGPTLAETDPHYLLDSMHIVPPLPAGARVLEAFVCDQYGVNSVGDVDGNGFSNEAIDERLATLGNAARFSGRITPGLINLNTTTPEVLQSCPHWCRLVHETGMAGSIPVPVPSAHVRVAEAAVRYRERLGTLPASADYAPNYTDRGTGVRGTRGFASIGELMLLTEKPDLVPALQPTPQYEESWTIDFAAADPFEFMAGGNPVQSTRVSTEIDAYDWQTGFNSAVDDVARDAEEANLLFAGASNVLTTRSDVFTVYFKVRSFRQNPVSGAWNATDPEYILDDSRYVMLVDRSEVNTPNDKPKILYMEKLPR